MSNQKVRFMWEINYFCNYRCAYCYYDSQWKSLKAAYPSYPTAEDWLGCWRRVGHKYGDLEIFVYGGEPLIFRGIVDLLEELSRRHALAITSNLSVPIDFLKAMVSRVDKNRFSVTASFHPQFASMDSFVKKAAFLRSTGCLFNATLVAYPPTLIDLDLYRRRFSEVDIPFNLKVFSGTYNSRTYPAAYTETERGILLPFLDRKVAVYTLGLERTFGKMCYSGNIYANVLPDGRVYRCSRVKDAEIGNIFNPEFELLPGPTPCPTQHCGCRMFQNLSEVYENARHGPAQEGLPVPPHL